MRRPNVGHAGVDLAFAALALALGVGGAPFSYAALAFLGAALLWAWTRRKALGAMPVAQLASNAVLALGLLAAVLGIAYWIGLAVGGHT